MSFHSTILVPQTVLLTAWIPDQILGLYTRDLDTASHDRTSANKNTPAIQLSVNHTTNTMSYIDMDHYHAAPTVDKPIAMEIPSNAHS